MFKYICCTCVQRYDHELSHIQRIIGVLMVCLLWFVLLAMFLLKQHTNMHDAHHNIKQLKEYFSWGSTTGMSR